MATNHAPDTPDHYWYRQGKDDGAQSERDAIVRWLRQYGPCGDGDSFADAIERGDHLKDTRHD